MTLSDLSLAYTFVTVHDHDEALTFYRDLLGLEVATDVTNDGFRWVTLVAPGTPGVQITLMDPRSGPAAPDAEALLDLAAKGSLDGLIFETGDVDALFERLSAAGADVIQEPVEQFYGVKDCAFRDPTGNMIRFNQRMATTP